jgi:hypothetical protein
MCEDRPENDLRAFLDGLVGRRLRALRGAAVVLDEQLHVRRLELGQRHFGGVLHRLRGCAGIAGGRHRQQQRDLDGPRTGGSDRRLLDAADRCARQRLDLRLAVAATDAAREHARADQGSDRAEYAAPGTGRHRLVPSCGAARPAPNPRPLARTLPRAPARISYPGRKRPEPPCQGLRRVRPSSAARHPCRNRAAF